jgi:hypothetical protein
LIAGPLIGALLLTGGCSSLHAFQIPRVDSKKQGFAMRMQINSVGGIGHMAYLPYNPGGIPGAPAESLGLEWPVGSGIEHLYGGGIWIGGLVDTSTRGGQPRLRLVSVTDEGWAGPYQEFYPGRAPGDTIWVTGRAVPEPRDWAAYWGPGFPYRPISDQDMHVTYTDSLVPVQGHIPMRLRVIQSSYAWDDPYADAIIIFEYRILNIGRQRIDSAYFAYFFDPEVGPLTSTYYGPRNFSAYLSDSRTAYAHNPVDRRSTPVGATLLATSGASLDSLRYTFQWFPGPNTPPTDAEKYAMLSSGVIREDEFPRLSETRFVFAFGPFSMEPLHVRPDTFLVAVAVISGDIHDGPEWSLSRSASRALDIYLNQGIKLPATPPSPPLRITTGFRRVELDWRWRAGDEERYGRPDPELNWDTTNQIARRYPDRITNPPSGVDSARGGRNFEAYRVWRSENPDFPDASFTLLAQYDHAPDSFEYETGLRYTFVDSNLVRGRTYVYAVTSRSIPSVAFQEVVSGDSVINLAVPVEPLESAKRTNAVRIELPFTVSTSLGAVAVVPNPYRTDRLYTLEQGGYEGTARTWDEGRRKIKFINLPVQCTIRVFSLAGDLVRTIRHDGTSADGVPRGDTDMLLVSDSNRALASGVYLFTVESPLGTQMGKFVVIR